MMKINVELAVYPDSIALDYKCDVLNIGLIYPFEDYVRDTVYNYFYDVDVAISEKEMKKIIEKAKEALDKRLEK